MVKNATEFYKVQLTRYAVSVRSLYKTYDDKQAVAGISLNIPEGEFYGLLGPNGAGKTTVMRAISGVLPPTNGSIEVCGIDVVKSSREVRKLMGIVTQSDGLDDAVVVKLNLAIFGHLSGMGWRASIDRAMEVLRFMDLEDRAEDDVNHLSGGMRRRLAIARALMARPKVIVLDEPTTGLDPHSRSKVWEQLGRMKREGVTILMSTHYMEEAAALCDRVGVMYEGRLLAEGTPEELVRKYAGVKVAILNSSNGVPDDVRLRLISEGRRVIGSDSFLRVLLNGEEESMPHIDGIQVTTRLPNLEDVFLVLTGKNIEKE